MIQFECCIVHTMNNLKLFIIQYYYMFCIRTARYSMMLRSIIILRPCSIVKTLIMRTNGVDGACKEKDPDNKKK